VAILLAAQAVLAKKEAAAKGARMRHRHVHVAASSLAILAACSSYDTSTASRAAEPASTSTSTLTNAATPVVRVVKTDPRAISNLRVTANFTINGQPHYDWEDTGAFDHTSSLGLDGNGGTWSGSAWVGDLLYTLRSNGSAPMFTVNKVDPRAITSLRLTVDFDINGAHHTDYEDVGAFDGTPIDLELDALGGTWDAGSSVWRGDFLRHAPRIRIAKTDPRAITSLRLIASYVVDGVAHADWEDIGPLDRTVHLGLDNVGKYGGNPFDTLTTEFSYPGLELVDLHRVVNRPVNDLLLTAEFTIAGAPHVAAHWVGDLTGGTIELQLDGRGGTWNGVAWTGNLLRPYATPTVVDTLPDPSMRMLTQHNDAHRTGANQREHTLTPANVAPGSFGRIGTMPVDGEVYGQPLYSREVVNGALRNVVYLATMHDTVYAYDADTFDFLWSNHVAEPYNIWTPALCDVNGTSPCNYTDYSWGARYGLYHDVKGEIGILSTPVIDTATHRMFVVAFTAAGGAYHHYLMALDTRNGSVVAGPKMIEATYAGKGDGAVNGVLTFDSKRQNQRPGLLLANGNVYIAFASYADTDPYHGWVMAYDANTLTQTGVFNTTPEAAEGGIWMAGQGPALDAAGNLYVAVGNSTPPGQPTQSNSAPSAGFDLGESIVKLSPQLNVVDWFAPNFPSPDPNNFVALNNSDADLGSAGLVTVPGTNLVYGGGKSGRIFLLDINNMGQSTASPHQWVDATDTAASPHHVHGAPIYVPTSGVPGNAMIYLWGESSQIRGFRMTSGVMASTPELQSSLSDEEIARGSMPGGFLSFSGDHVGKGVIFASHTAHRGGSGQGTYDPGRLWAFDAATLRTLWTSTDVPARDDLGMFGKFSPPTVMNGRVYVATFSNQVAVYGLLY
jgi:hypothetical protein